MANYFDDHDDEGHSARTALRKAEIERCIAAPLRARIAELEREVAELWAKMERVRGFAQLLLSSPELGSLCRCCGRADAIGHDACCGVPYLLEALGDE